MIAIHVKQLAEAKGISMSQLHRRADVTLGLVRRYWRNETTSVDLRALDSLCAVLDCQVSDVLVRTDGPPYGD